jgi:predicted transcriptional regulator
MDLKDVMKQRREFLGISQLDLSEMAGVSLATIKDIERGKGNPALSTVNKILMVLGLEITYQVRQPIQQ